ncbi:hypothetical protein [Alkalihalobacillus sp. AL-G]|uniref:hypothetical protein n=1 Tax=Alkalihalobacillus sp. AL-G TaxID=2926399 RepID=UPI0027296F30|nr:hypothetical protein [Alkalihalobacillus sp. AL-G]WLD93000.1 hypothetical protein MOJ78_18670 [Alkalihalobacillus sp. AL-G]
MNIVLGLLSFIIAVFMVTVTPLVDSVVITEPAQLEHHRLGYPLPIIEQHTTLSPMKKDFPFRLGIVDPHNHPTDILFKNYLISTLIMTIFIFIFFWLMKRIIFVLI